MKKSEIKKVIEIETARDGNYGLVSFTLTEIIYGGKIPFAATKEEFEEIVWEDNLSKAAVVIEKEDGEIIITVDSGERRPPEYTVEEFAEKYGE